MASGRGARAMVTKKLVLLGDTNVGKSCLALQLTRGEFVEYQEPTIGSAFLSKDIALDDITVKFEIWDTAGQERYRSLAPMYYRGAAVAIVVFDVSSSESFDGAKRWVKELQRQGDPGVIIGLAGNKCDLPKENRQVSYDDAREYAEDQEIVFFETSAKTGINVKELFTELAKRVPKEVDTAAAGVDLDEDSSKRGGCCGGGGA